MNLSLKGKKALIGGSTQGIGLAIATQLADQECEVVLISRSEESLKKAVDEIGKLASYLVADFSDYGQILACEERIKNEKFDILVNNAGGPPPGLASEAEWESFQNAIDIHLKTSHALAKWTVPSMREKQYGRIINIISTSVKIPIPGLGVSNTVRGAMASWSKTMSNELAQYGITVNNILPGPIETNRLKGLIESIAERKGVSVTEVEDEMKQSVPAKRFGRPEELGALAAFLCSDHAAYINGTSIPVDGGRTGSI